MATTTSPPAPATARPARPVSALDAVRDHWLFALLFVVGVALRVVTFLAYRPALLYIDSLSYLSNIGPLRPSGARPIGYSIFLRPLTVFGDLRVVPIVQHGIGLALAVGIYVLLRRAGTRRWLAAFAAAPMLLDAYQLQIEQNVLSETLFQAMIFVGLVLLIDGVGRRRSWPRRLVTAGVAGAVLGMAVPVRLIGQAVVVAGVGYLLLERGRRWSQRIVAAGLFAAVFAIPVLTYMAYFQAWTGDFTLTPVGGRVMYGRTAVLVDCDRIEIPADQRDLCPDEPLGQRLKIDNYVWNQESPINRHDPPRGLTEDESLREFAGHVIRQQPVDVAQAVLIDMGKMFWPTKAQFDNDVDVGRWQFQEVYPRYGHYRFVLNAYDARPQVAPVLAAMLRRYQLSIGYTPGPVLLVALLVGLSAGLGFGRARGSPLRAACLLFAVTGAMLALLPAVYEFSWRYMLPALVTMPVAGALGVTAFTDRIRTMTATADQPATATTDDAIDRAATTRFTRMYQAPRLGPIAVVIAAYNEQDAIGDVLGAIPTTIEATPVSVVVIDDGSADATGDVARRHGAMLVEPGVNRGQGAALRLGYRVAREHGATIIATLDADGQYDPAELRTVVAPILRGEADFVTGSRRLGREETTDNFRRAGVRFYAWLVSVLTRQRITDTSFGLRAMRAEVTSTVTLRQPQYQSSELLIGALAHGFRVVEVPTTMRQRTAGESKKGHNLLYGLRYGGVVVGTWLRERAPRGARRGQKVDPSGAPGTPDDPAGRTSRGTTRR
ncbi:MAG: glycosyltransferase family 2 protein [Actinobacteria bacterium]|nr:glycosyltransferase family 2 protein [Actinomycetota bacterium]